MTQLSVLCWNVFHGRDAPPDRSLFTRRSRWLRRTEANATHVQVNRSLRSEYAGLIAAADWDVCLLQECPPAWAVPLVKQSHANGFRVLTSRNQLGPLGRLTGRLNPDLVGSNEGGSNLILVRQPWRVTQTRSLLLNPWPGRGRGERRRMAFARIEVDGSPVCVTNLHASANEPSAAEPELLRAAEHALEWAGGDPLLLAGDFNVRPKSSTVFDRLERDFGLTGATAPDAIDHLLSRGLEVVTPPFRWEVARRELTEPWRGEARRLRLSDHAPVEAAYLAK
jgi:endonuclease/exonuclease/phosphatase family metal-dependent hydrolase